MVIDVDKKMLGEMDTRDAVRLAREKGYDLVEVSPLARPPVCRIMDFGKYIYERKRRERESRKKQRTISVREMRFSLKISNHDYQVKLRKIFEFINRGDKVKVSLFLRGREALHANLAMNLMARLVENLSEKARVEVAPKREGPIIYATFLPKR